MCSTSTCAETRTIGGILPGPNLLSMYVFLDSSPEHRSALSHRLLSTLPVVLLSVLYLQGSPQSTSTSGGPHMSSPNSCSFVEDVLAPKIVSTENETLRRFSSVAVPQHESVVHQEMITLFVCRICAPSKCLHLGTILTAVLYKCCTTDLTSSWLYSGVHCPQW